jgi:hypothetical protein
MVVRPRVGTIEGAIFRRAAEARRAEVLARCRSIGSTQRHCRQRVGCLVHGQATVGQHRPIRRAIAVTSRRFYVFCRPNRLSSFASWLVKPIVDIFVNSSPAMEVGLN